LHFFTDLMLTFLILLTLSVTYYFALTKIFALDWLICWSAFTYISWFAVIILSNMLVAHPHMSK
jgi:hypothetical protein